MIKLSPVAYAVVSALLVGANAAVQSLSADPSLAKAAMWLSIVLALAMKVEQAVVVPPPPPEAK